MFGLQLSRIYRGFKWISRGWTVKLLFVSVGIICSRFPGHLEKQLWFVATAHLTVAYFFLVGALPAIGPGKNIFRFDSHRWELAVIFALAFCFQLLSFVFDFGLTYVRLYMSYEVGLDLVALICLAIYYKKLRLKFPGARLLVSATFFYVLLELLSKGRATKPDGMFEMQRSTMEFAGFCFGLTAKSLIVIGFSGLLMRASRQFTMVDKRLRVKKAVVRELTGSQVITLLQPPLTINHGMLLTKGEQPTGLPPVTEGKVGVKQIDCVSFELLQLNLSLEATGPSIEREPNF
jgi:hypothetical protein